MEFGSNVDRTAADVRQKMTRNFHENPCHMFYRVNSRLMAWHVKLVTLDRGKRSIHRIFGFFLANRFNPVDIYYWTKTFLVHKNIFLFNFFIFDERGPIFILAVVAVFPKQVLLRQSTPKPGAQTQPPKDMHAN